jgi:hypothetical protein
MNRSFSILIFLACAVAGISKGEEVQPRVATNDAWLVFQNITIDTRERRYSLLELHSKATNKLKLDFKDYRQDDRPPFVYFHTSEEKRSLTFYYFHGFGQKTWSVTFNNEGHIISAVESLAAEQFRGPVSEERRANRPKNPAK